MNAIFNLLDVDHSGIVTKENLIMAMARGGRKVSLEEVRLVI